MKRFTLAVSKQWKRTEMPEARWELTPDNKWQVIDTGYKFATDYDLYLNRWVIVEVATGKIVA